MLPSDSDDWVLTMDKATGKLLDKKPTRTRKRTDRAQQMDEINERARERREKQEAKKKLAIEAKQSQVADDNDQFAFGPAADFIEPTYTGNDALDNENFKASRATFLLRKLEHFSGKDLRPAWQRGELSLDELEATFQAAMAGNPTPAAAAKDKGKGRAMEVDDGRPSNYDGIKFGRRIPADIDSSDEDNQHVQQPATKSGSRNKPAPTAARSKFSPLTRTDSETVLDGKVLFYPQNLPPDARIHVPPTSATVPGSPARKKPRHLPAPGAKPTSSQPRRPSGSLKISSFGPTKPPKNGSQSQSSHIANSVPTRQNPPDRVPPPPLPPSQNPRQPAREGNGSQAQPRHETVANWSLNRDPHPPPPNVHLQAAPSPDRRANRPHHGEVLGNAARNPPARAGQVANQLNPRNPRPNPRSPTPSDIDGEVELATIDEDGDAPALVNVPGMPVDPGMAILHNGKATLASFALVTHPTVRFMRQRSKAKIISIGSYDWEHGDAGEEVPSVDHIVTYNFSVASRKMGSNYPFLMEHILHVQIVVRTERSNIKRSLEQVVIRFFNFSADPEYNQQRSQELLPNTFHQLVTREGVIPFGSPYIREACRQAVFDGQNSLGIRYPNYFNPIPWRFLAFIGAITNNIIHAWRTGYYKREKLDVTQQLPVFRRYLKLLEEMHTRQPNYLEELCGSIHDDARAQYERTLHNSPTPEPPVQWAPDTVERYVPRFAKRHSPSAVSSEDEQPGAYHGDGLNTGNQGERVHYRDPPPRDSPQSHAVPDRPITNRYNDRAGGPGASQSRHAAGYESQTNGAGPSRQQHRQRADSGNSDDLPGPEQVRQGRGTMRSAGGVGQDDGDVAMDRGRRNDDWGGQHKVDTQQAPRDAEAVEFPDEQEWDAGEGVN